MNAAAEEGKEARRNDTLVGCNSGRVSLLLSGVGNDDEWEGEEVCW